MSVFTIAGGCVPHRVHRKSCSTTATETTVSSFRLTRRTRAYVRNFCATPRERGTEVYPVFFLRSRNTRGFARREAGVPIARRMHACAATRSKKKRGYFQQDLLQNRGAGSTIRDRSFEERSDSERRIQGRRTHFSWINVYPPSKNKKETKTRKKETEDRRGVKRSIFIVRFFLRYTRSFPPQRR